MRNFTALLLVFIASWLYAGTFELSVDGSSGTALGKRFEIGSSARAFLQDAFVAVPDLDLNGSAQGTAGRLSLGQLPLGVTSQFGAFPQAGGETILLEYTLKNEGQQSYPSLRFLYYLDLEIGESSNTFFNEHAAVTGLPVQGGGSAGADSFMIDEPGFEKGANRDRLSDAVLKDNLDNQNHVPGTASNDVALCLGFGVGDFRPGDRCVVRILVSSEGVSTGALAVVHYDEGTASPTCITVSGVSSRYSDWCRLAFAVSGNGAVSVTNGWYRRGETIPIQAIPAAGARFLKWSGDVPVEVSTNSSFMLTLDRDYQISAEFIAESGADLATVYRSERQVVKPGDRFPLQLKVSNNGPDKAGYALAGVTDGCGLQWLNAKAPQGHVDILGQQWMIDPLALGDEVTLQVTAQAAMPLDVVEVQTNIPLPQDAAAFCLFPDGRLAVRSSNDGQVIAPFRDGLTAVSVFSDGSSTGMIRLLTQDGQLFRELTAPAGAAGRAFGAALAGSGQDLLAIGAPAISNGTTPGAVYILDLASSNAAPKLLAESDSSGNVDGFGSSVCLLSSGVAVGAPDASYAGVEACGVVYLYGFDGALRGTILDPVPQPGARFGASLASVGDGLMAAAIGDANSSQTGACVQVFDSAGCWVASIPPAESLQLPVRMTSAGNRQLWLEQFDGATRWLGGFSLPVKNLAVVSSTAYVLSRDGSCVDGILSNNMSAFSLVIDAEAPKFSGQSTFELAANADGYAAFSGPFPTVSDNYGVVSTWGGVPELPCRYYGTGTNHVDYWAVDAAGNTGAFTQVIRVVDLMPPYMEAPENLELPLGEDGTCRYTGALPIAKDNTDSNPIVTSDPALPVTFTATGTYTIVYTATDVSTNVSRVSQTITVFKAAPTNEVFTETRLTVEAVATEYSDPLALRALLTAEGHPCTGAVIRFTVAGQSVGDAITGPDGYARLTYASMCIPGRIDIGASFDRDTLRHLEASESAADVLIQPEKATLELLIGAAASGDLLLGDNDFALAAKVRQENDGTLGDITKAVVAFAFSQHLADDSFTNLYSAMASCDASGLAALDLEITPGLYTVSAGTTTNSYFKATPQSESIVSVGSAEGKVTGGGNVSGWTTPSASSGKATFGFTVQRDTKGIKGNVEFKCKEVGLELKGTSLDWLVVNRNCAQFQGQGTLKGRSGTFTFQIFCIDAPGNGGNGAPDHMTLRIWEGIDTKRSPVYQLINQPIDGNITVH